MHSAPPRPWIRHWQCMQVGPCTCTVAPPHAALHLPPPHPHPGRSAAPRRISADMSAHRHHNHPLPRPSPSPPCILPKGSRSQRYEARNRLWLLLYNVTLYGVSVLVYNSSPTKKRNIKRAAAANLFWFGLPLNNVVSNDQKGNSHPRVTDGHSCLIQRDLGGMFNFLTQIFQS